MIEVYNYIFNKNIPLTRDGYRQIGSSDNIVKSIAQDPIAFYKFISIQSNVTPYTIVRDIFLSKSRNF